MYLSLFIGMLLGALLFIMFFNKNTIYKGPNSKDIKSKIFHFDNTNVCYKLEPQIYLCPAGTKHK